MTLGTDDEPRREPRIRSRLELAWRWVLIAGWTAVLAATVATGTRQATWHDLRGAVAAGDVRTVSTTPGLGPHTLGSEPVEVTWRDGVIRYRTTVTEKRPQQRVPPPRVVRDVEDELAGLQPDLVVRHHPWVTSSSEMLGWRVSPWIAGVAVGLGLFTLLLLINPAAAVASDALGVVLAAQLTARRGGVPPAERPHRGPARAAGRDSSPRRGLGVPARDGGLVALQRGRRRPHLRLWTALRARPEGEWVTHEALPTITARPGRGAADRPSGR